MSTGKLAAVRAAAKRLSRRRLLTPRRLIPRRRPSEPGSISPGARTMILAGTTVTVTAVAAFAGIQSYSHIYWLAATHRQDGLDSALSPLPVDGLIVAFSLVILFFSVTGQPVPLRARGPLWLGVIVTIAANVAYGIPAGIIGALVSAWPAVAFVFSAEGLMMLVRAAAGTRPAHPETVTADASETVAGEAPSTPPSTLAPVPERTPQPRPERTAPRPAKRTASAPDARAEYDAELAAGRIPSVRLTMRAHSVGSKRAKEIRAQLERDRDDLESEAAPGPHLTIAREG